MCRFAVDKIMVSLRTNTHALKAADVATNQQLVRALRNAAEAFLSRPLREGEEKQLLDYFNNATGSYADRAEEAIWRLTGAPQTTVLKNLRQSRW